MKRPHTPGPVPPTLVLDHIGANQNSKLPELTVRFVVPSFSFTLNFSQAALVPFTTSAVPSPNSDENRLVCEIGL